MPETSSSSSSSSAAPEVPQVPPAVPVSAPASSAGQQPTGSSSNEAAIIYGKIPRVPTQPAVDGVRFDFCSGLRVFFPPVAEGEAAPSWRLRFWDEEAGIMLYDSEGQPDTVVSAVKKYFMRYRLEIVKDGKAVFSHTMDLAGQKVVVQLPVRTLGDSIAWFSYLERFHRKHGCELYVVCSDVIRGIFEKQYPEFRFIGKEAVPLVQPYAVYYLGLFFNGDNNHQPVDFRLVGLHQTAGLILGLRTREELADEPPRVDLSAPRKIAEPYAVIATKATAQCKYWNNPFGWEEVIRDLRSRGLRVLCIDKDRVHGAGTHVNHIPWGVEDFTGDRPLQERIDLIKDAEVFVGLSSGLSWLAWCCRVPVVLVSGFSMPFAEFYTPYRAINFGVCNGCWNDVRLSFDHHDFLWCPRHAGDETRQFECSRKIGGKQVTGMLAQILDGKFPARKEEENG